jgi:hypothetical protein
MSTLVDLFNNSKKPRPTQSRTIPDAAVNFFDVQNTYQTEWKNGFKRGDPTTYTDKALAYYDDERTQMVIPPSFIQHLPDIPLNRYSPDTTYYNPGQASS